MGLQIECTVGQPGLAECALLTENVGDQKDQTQNPRPEMLWGKKGHSSTVMNLHGVLKRKKSF